MAILVCDRHQMSYLWLSLINLIFFVKIHRKMNHEVTINFKNLKDLLINKLILMIEKTK